MVIFDLMNMSCAGAVRCDYLARGKIDPFHFTVEEASVFQHLPDRVDDMGYVDVARCDLVEHRCEEKEILPIDDGNFDVLMACDRFFKSRRGVQSREAAT